MEDFSKYNKEGSALRSIQLRILDILIIIDKICRDNGIDYWLDYGTLLGAVRHSGFIPWDDDVDIAVRYEDKDTLKTTLMKELPDDLFYQDSETDAQHCWTFAKVRDSKTKVLEEKEMEDYDKPHGVFVDIFPHEKCFSPRLKKIIDVLYGRCYRARRHHLAYTKSDVFIAHLLWPFAWTLVKVYRYISNLVNAKKRMQIFGSFARLYSFREEDVFPLCEVTFEGHKFFAPKDYDKYLSSIYGDYMKIPEEKDRNIHMVKVEYLNK